MSIGSELKLRSCASRAATAGDAGMLQTIVYCWAVNWFVLLSSFIHTLAKCRIFWWLPFVMVEVCNRRAEVKANNGGLDTENGARTRHTLNRFVADPNAYHGLAC